MDIFLWKLSKLLSIYNYSVTEMFSTTKSFALMTRSIWAYLHWISLIFSLSIAGYDFWPMPLQIALSQHIKQLRWNEIELRPKCKHFTSVWQNAFLAAKMFTAKTRQSNNLQILSKFSMRHLIQGNWQSIIDCIFFWNCRFYFLLHYLE